MDAQRRKQARRNLQLLIEAYLREESSMRWGATNAQIRSAAKQMANSGLIPAKVVIRVKEHLNALRQQGSGQMG